MVKQIWRGAYRQPRSFPAIITSLIGIKGVTKIATTRLMPLHVGKGRNISTAIADIIDYVENPQKTDFGKFIYGYECDTRLADAEFLLSKRQYANLTGRNQGADDVIAYHLRQAFKPGEVTPEEANQIGRELALKLTK